MPSLEPRTYDALLYTSIGLGGAAGIAAFSVWWFSRYWMIIMVSILAGIVIMAMFSVLLLEFYVKREQNIQTGVSKRTAGTSLITNVNNKTVPGAAYKLKVAQDSPLFLTVAALTDQIYQLTTTTDKSIAAEFIFEPVGQVNELTIRPAIFYYVYTLIGGNRYYATTVQSDKNLDSYSIAEVNDPFLYFRPRLTSTDPAVRDAQFRLWPYNALPEFKWQTDRSYEVKETDQVYLSFYKYIKMNQGCTLYQASINYVHAQFSLFNLA